MANRNFLKKFMQYMQYMAWWAPYGTCPKGWTASLISLNQQEEVPEVSGDEERLPVITFFLGILAALYVKEKENSESLDVLLAKVKVDCHEYFQTWS